MKMAAGRYGYLSGAALVLVLCGACSKESGEVEWQEEEILPGQSETCHTEPAEMHEGRYSVYEYEFKGRGEPHADEDCNYRGSEVVAKIHLEWPEAEAGLTEAALSKVRKAILWAAFSDEAVTHWIDLDHPVRYIVPEALGETEEALKARNKELCALEGYVWEEDKFGLSPSDWGRLTVDALSPTGVIANRGQVTGDALDLAIEGIKRKAHDDYKCDLSQKGHCCSRWTFIVDLRLDWPFGLGTKAGAEWYGQPVICVENEGYSNDGGNGCHDQYVASVFSLPDGRELGPDDYFAADTMDKLSQMVTERLYRECLDEAEAKERSQYSLDLKEAHMLVTKEGIKWTWDPYSILAGCYGAPSVTIPWEELTPFRK